MIGSTPNPAWPLRSDAENAGQTTSFPLDGVTLPPGFKARPIACAIDAASKSEMVSLHVSIRPTGLVEAIESVEALQNALRSGKLADASLQGIKALLDLACVDLGDLATFGAEELSLHLQPTEKYLRCVAAIAARDADRHVVRLEFRHGWPILSVESRIPTVAEGAAPASAAPEAAKASEPRFTPNQIAQITEIASLAAAKAIQSIRNAQERAFR